MTARFSMGGGNPNISDKTKPTTRGFAMEFEDPSGTMVFYFVSAPIFSTKTPRQLLDFVTVRLPGPDGKPDPEKIRAFATANPETTRQAAWLNARPVPASFAGVDYWGVQAYTLTNGKGEATITKLKAVAGAGQLGLGDDELKSKPDSFYAEELKERLGKGQVTFDFVAILGEQGDPTSDSTEMWPEEKRKAVKLGTIASRLSKRTRSATRRPAIPCSTCPRASPARRTTRCSKSARRLTHLPVAPGAVKITLGGALLN
jgi:catalase